MSSEIIFYLGAHALHQRQTGEAGEVGIRGTVEAGREFLDCLGAMPAGGACQRQKGGASACRGIASSAPLRPVCTPNSGNITWNYQNIKSSVFIRVHPWPCTFFVVLRA